MKKPKVGKKIFRVLTGMVIGSAIGSILGLTLAPKKGEDTRKYIKDKSMEVFLNSKKSLEENGKKMGFFKRMLVKFLTRKK